MASRYLRIAVATGACALAGLAPAATPAAAASLVTYSPGSFGSSIFVNGETNDDLITITVEGNNVAIDDAGTGGISTVDPDCTNFGGFRVNCPLDPPDPAPPAQPAAPVAGASGALGAGNDSFASSGPFGVGANGGDGDDTLNGGPENDSFVGGDGNDTLLGGDGDDQLDGSGSPFSADGADLLDGQGGNDLVSFTRQLGVNVSLNAQPDDGFPGEGDNAIAERVFTGEGDDVITGDAGPNVLSAGDGNDLVSGLEGADLLFGGRDDDGLVGGGQADHLECGADLDVSAVDALDAIQPDCERIGAEPMAGTAIVSRKGRAKATVSCPVEEANECTGELALLSSGKELGTGGFEVGAGSDGTARVKLDWGGRRALERSGGALLVTAEARTDEPVGTSVRVSELLLRTKRGPRGGA